MTVVKLLTFSSILWLKSVRTANPTIHDKHEAEQVATILYIGFIKRIHRSYPDIVVIRKGITEKPLNGTNFVLNPIFVLWSKLMY